MRLIDADALIEFCAERWIPLNIDAVNMQPTIQPEKAQHSQEGTTKGTTSDTIQPEPTDIDAREAVYNLAEKIGIHQLFALTVELRGEPIQPEPSIPLSWVEKHIEWLKGFDNEFANLAAAHISVMVKKWRDEQNETD